MEKYFNIRYEFDRESVYRAIDERLKNPGSDYICVASGTIVTQVHKNKQYRDVVNNGMFAICDSSYVPLYLKMLYGIERQQFSGSQIFEKIIKEKKYKMYFLGTSREVLADLKQNLIRWNENVKDMPFVELPFCDADKFNYKEIAEDINKNKPDIIWVALGAPKQEFFMNYLKPYLDHGVMLAVGAAFNFYSSEKSKRAPEWMVKNHLEFLYRIFQEPKKQIKRCWDDIKTLPFILTEEKFKK